MLAQVMQAALRQEFDRFPGTGRVVHVVSDDYVGTLQALALYFPDGAHQRYQVRYIRNALSSARMVRSELVKAFADAWAAPESEELPAPRSLD